MSEVRRERYRRFKAVDEAYKEGDLDALRAALGDPPDFPNCRHPLELAVGDWPLEYAIYSSPRAFIDALLELGADPNYPDRVGFPSVIAALSSERRDRLDIVARLIEAGADLAARGHNDWTALHYAVWLGDPAAVRLLLDRGADPALRTRIDDGTTALEDAEARGFDEGAALLRAAMAGKDAGAGR